MYHWLLIAIWAPLLWAFSNHIDKYLITRFGAGLGIKGLITLSSLLSIFIAVGAFIFDSQIFSISFSHQIFLIISGSLYAFAVLSYLFALSEGEASAVTPVFQLIPVFAFILGFIFLGETLSMQQIFGGLIVILGAIFISLDLKKFEFKKKSFLFMAFASLLFAVYQILFKAGGGDGFAIAIFWQAIGTTLAGLFFLFLPSFRKEFISVFRQKSFAMFGWSIIVEIFTMGGNLLVSRAILLAPATALVLLVEAFQPICVFFLGIIITLLLPFFAKEDLSRKIIFQKLFAIVIILVGSYFLYF